MDTHAVAQAFTALVKEGKDQEAQDLYYSDDIHSLETGPGEHADVKGRKALAAKYAWWEDNAEMHSYTTEGPMVNGHQFVLKFSMDVTMKGMGRMQMDEVALYTVKDGKIVEERFFYDMGG